MDILYSFTPLKQIIQQNTTQKTYPVSWNGSGLLIGYVSKKQDIPELLDSSYEYTIEFIQKEFIVTKKATDRTRLLNRIPEDAWVSAIFGYKDRLFAIRVGETIEINLSDFQRLRYVTVDSRMMKLDVRNCPFLTEISCWGDLLEELLIKGCPTNCEIDLNQDDKNNIKCDDPDLLNQWMYPMSTHSPALSVYEQIT